MNPSNLFSTKERIRILEKIIYTKLQLSVNKTAKELGLSKGLVSKFFNILTKEDILIRVGSRGNKFLVLENLYARIIRILLTANRFDPNLFKRYEFVESVGLYGRSARGTNSDDSDIEIWIRIRKTKEDELKKLANELKEKYERIKPLFLTKVKLKILKEKDPVFYYSLLFGSIGIYN